ncbi:MAG: Mov34/MPN/PAD-1 family protein [Candidatus Hodarchaeota archaeon]
MIRIPKSIYEKFLRFALENANPLDSRDWRECIGLVLGRITKHEIFVTDIVPIGTGTAVFVDINDYEKVFSLISPSRIDHGEVIVGWAHTHPGLGLFLSSTDIHTQQMYQQMHPKAFALVLDPTKISSGFSGFNIYRLDEFGSNPTTVDYSFDEECDFFTIRETITSELFITPKVPVLEAPKIISESEVLWKGIRIMIKGEKEISVNRSFQVKIEIDLPFRQFIRIEYRVKTDNITDNPFTRKLIYQKVLYHETITSGTLGIFTFRTKMIGTVRFRISNFFLIDYNQNFQKMPDLLFKTQIRGE